MEPGLAADLLDALPETAPRQAYAEAIIEDNLLGKQTTATRKLTNQRLGELYGLTPTLPLFAVLRRAWARDQPGRPLIALLCALARDPLLKASQQAVLPLPAGAELMRSSLSGALRAATGHRLNDSILDKVAESCYQRAIDPKYQWDNIAKSFESVLSCRMFSQLIVLVMRFKQ